MKVGALLLTPGAGADRNHSALRAIEVALAPLPVARIDFPYRKAGRRSPDKPPVAIQCIRDEAEQLLDANGVKPNALALGGRSFGGRMCSLAVAQGLPAAALVLISYPLHPPGKPDTLRVEHFAELKVPCLFISGTRDPFGTPAELEKHASTISGPVTHIWIEGGGHDFKKHDEQMAADVAAWVRKVR